ncbi:DEKNAAC104051 [Brettanomyces naardenensis]|uniref:Phosphatidate cytidylyltransferase n=1 Tax=Brettanomyces naardenensis TaxID=13370 RepID=A0A448YPR6_BRENA|nr:DEKNAAC104051 [Brettanomyces naardenensis]
MTTIRHRIVTEDELHEVPDVKATVTGSEVPSLKATTAPSSVPSDTATSLDPSINLVPSALSGTSEYDPISSESESRTNSITAIPSQQPAVNEKERKQQAIIVRTIATLIMLVGFFALIGLGPFWTITAVLVLQVAVFRELIAITTRKAYKIKELSYTGYLNWYFLATTIFYLEGRSFLNYSLNYLIESDYTSAIAIRLALHHKFICYCLYVLGFVGFVASLKKGYLKFQFAQLCITHMIMLLVILQGHCIVNNILHGMIWFVLPVGLVITNDIFAYICGITFGRTQLISISPKKTVEGFVGAWICTTLMSLPLTYVLSNRAYLICPFTNDLGVNCLSGIQCDPNPVFIHQIYRLPSYLSQWFEKDFIQLKPVYLHAVILSMFASLIAPFGGFFASGLKRAFKIKDFGDTIPGHGGVTDRMDCQFLMGSFSYLYYETFISAHQLNVGNLLQTIIINLSGEEIVLLVRSLHSYLYKIGVIDDEVYGRLNEVL